jgi:hypothetical protein
MSELIVLLKRNCLYFESIVKFATYGRKKRTIAMWLSPGSLNEAFDCLLILR